MAQHPPGTPTYKKTNQIHPFSNRALAPPPENPDFSLEKSKSLIHTLAICANQAWIHEIITRSEEIKKVLHLKINHGILTK